MIQVCKDIVLRIFAKISFASTRGFKRHGEIFFDRFLFFFMFFFSIEYHLKGMQSNLR